jgi:hypothetical protein
VTACRILPLITITISPVSGWGSIYEGHQIRSPGHFQTFGYDISRAARLLVDNGMDVAASNPWARNSGTFLWRLPKQDVWVWYLMPPVGSIRQME